MARAKRQWSALRTEIGSLIGETIGTGSAWSDATALAVWNAKLDLRMAQMADADEDWLTERVVYNLAAGTASYALTAGSNDVKRVLRIRTADGMRLETPLERADRWSESAVTTGATNAPDYYLPTYRLQGGNLILDPAPSFSETGGLEVETEPYVARFAADSATLPAHFPDIMETLLVWDTAEALIDIEAAKAVDGDFSNPLAVQTAHLARVFMDAIVKRQKTPIRSRRMDLGG